MDCKGHPRAFVLARCSRTAARGGSLGRFADGRSGRGKLVQQGKHRAERLLAPGDLLVLLCGFTDGCVPQLGRRPQGSLQSAGALGVPRPYLPDQPARGLGESVLQVGPGPPDLLGDQIGGLAAQVLSGAALPCFTGEVAPNRPSQQFSLAGFSSARR